MGRVAEQVAIVGGEGYRNFGLEQRTAARQSLRLRGELDSSGAAFQRHANRIGETVLLYAALGAAAAAATSAVSLASTIDTESRRLEAVLNLSPAQGREFIGGVFDTAVQTATPVEDLLSESDLIASAFAGVTDQAEKQRLSLALLNDVGKITTVTQRDVATETQNLIAIMQLGGLSVEELGAALGQVTAAGNNSSTAIAAILDALNIALPGAKLAGVSIEQLIALTGLFRNETQRAGSEIGNTFKTLFQTITQPEAENNISDLTNGLVSLRDEAGNLRPALEILLEIKSLIDSGSIDPGRLNDIFKAFAPPLNPGAAKDIAIIFDLLDQLPAALREVEKTGGDALTRLVDKLNAALGPQFRILIEEIKQGFFELFGDEIIGTGQALIDLLRSIGAVLHALPPELITGVAGIVALAAAIKGVVFIGGALVNLLGFRGITGALVGAQTAAAAAGTSFGIMAGAAAGLHAVLSRVLPLLIAFAALDLAQQVGASQTGLKADIGASAVGLDAAGLQALRDRLSAQLSPLDDSDPNRKPEGPFSPFIQATDPISALTTDPALREGIAEIDRLLAELEDRGAGAKVSLDDLGEGFIGAADASTTIEEAIASQAEEMERLIAQYTGTAEAAAGMTEAQRIEADAAQLLEATRKGQAADLEKLGERYREGKISAEEFAQGQQIVGQAAELAATLVATAGDRLAEYPLFAAAAAEGNDALTAKVYEMIVASGGSINAISGLIGSLGNLAAANAAVAGSLAANPLVIKIAVSKVSSTDLANNPELSAARRFAQNATGRSVTNPSGSDGVEAQIKSILDNINNFLGGGGAGTSAFGNIPSFSSPSSSSSTSVPKPDILDLGDFDEAMLAQAIDIARRLQSSIPGADDAATGEILNLIKDAEFLQTVNNLDADLLRKAIERLTDIEEARLALEKQRAPMLQSLVVNQGSLSSLTTMPATFNGGTFVGGSGLNANPDTNTISINIGTISGQALTKAQIEKLMYDVFQKALADAAKL